MPRTEWPSLFQARSTRPSPRPRDLLGSCDRQGVQSPAPTPPPPPTPGRGRWAPQAAIAGGADQPGFQMWPSRAGDSATEGPQAPVPPAPLPASPAHPNKRPRRKGRGPRRGMGRAGARSGARGRRGGGAHLRGGRGLRTLPGGPQRGARSWRAATWPLRRGGRVDSGPGKTDLEKGRRRRRWRQRRGGGSAREEGPRRRRAGERRKRGPGPRWRPGGPCCASRARASRTQPPPRSSVGGSALHATRPARPPGEHVRVPP